MSTHWNLHCAQCVDAEPLLSRSTDHTRNADDALRVLYKYRFDLSAAATALQALLADPDLWMEGRLDGRLGIIDPDWFRVHSGHPLVLRSEYGDEERMP